MATISKIEDLLVWQKSRLVVREVFSITSLESFSREFFLKDQLKRSAISVMSNIAGGFDRGGNKEFIHFLYNANGSLNELKSQLYISTDFNLVSTPDIEVSLKLILEIKLIIKALSKKLKLSDFTGVKFKKQNSETLN